MKMIEGFDPFNINEAAMLRARIDELETALRFMLDRFENREGNIFSQRLACEKARTALAASVTEPSMKCSLHPEKHFEFVSNGKEYVCVYCGVLTPVNGK